MSIDEQIRRGDHRMQMRIAILTGERAREEAIAQEVAEEGWGIDVRLASTLHHGQVLYHVRERNVDGTPLRARVNGALKVWKRRPWKFQLPMKVGFFQSGCFHLHDGMAHDWRTREEWARGR